MIKVLHLISGGDSGGAKTHIFALMKGFNNIVDAKIMCFIHESFYDEAKELGINIELAEQRNRFDLSAMDKVVKEINEGDYDLVHCHGARANFNAMFIRSKIKVPMITTLHSDYKLDFKDNFIKNLVFTPLNVYALKRFDYYIAITERFKEMLVKRGFKDSKINVAYNGIDLKKKEEYVTKEEFLKRYGLEKYSDRMLFGIAARLDKVKDHWTLLHAIERRKYELQDTHTLIAGTGSEEEALRTFVKDRGLEDLVSFLGHVEDPYSLFNAIDVNMLVSISESFPYALLEGVKMKRPFIATNVGGIPEMVGDSKGAVLFDVGDIDALGEILVDFKRNPDKIKPMGEAIYHQVEENFSIEAMAERHLNIYKKMLAGGKNEDH